MPTLPTLPDIRSQQLGRKGVPPFSFAAVMHTACLPRRADVYHDVWFRALTATTCAWKVGITMQIVQLVV